MISLGQLAVLLGAELQGGSAELKIHGVSSIRQALPGTLVFAADRAAFGIAITCSAAAVLVSPETAGQTVATDKPLLLSAQPRLAFARGAKFLTSASQALVAPSIHPTAVVAPGARVSEDVSIGAHAFVDDQAHIGRASIIGAGAVLGRGVVIGDDCHIYPRVVLYPGTMLGNRVIVHAGAILGGDGFGYVRDPATGEYLQFPQQGMLVIEDDVEIGANTTIDRGALEETRISRGAKIDNLVHLGHNVSIGRNVIIAAQTGISGSSTIGDNAILGGQVGIGDHAQVGDGVILGGQAGILPNKKLHGPGIAFWGTPAQPLKRYLKQLAGLAKLSRSSTGATSARRHTSPGASDPGASGPTVSEDE